MYITDSPQIFTVTTIMKEFFGREISDIAEIPHDMQIFLRENHAFSEIQANYIIDKKRSHKQFDIYATFGHNDPRQAQYRVDSILEPENILNQ